MGSAAVGLLAEQPGNGGAGVGAITLVIAGVILIVSVVGGFKVASSRGYAGLLGAAAGLLLGPIGVALLFALPNKEAKRRQELLIQARFSSAVARDDRESGRAAPSPYLQEIQDSQRAGAPVAGGPPGAAPAPATAPYAPQPAPAQQPPGQSPGAAAGAPGQAPVQPSAGEPPAAPPPSPGQPPAAAPGQA